jgi:hypothetical protein
MGKSFLTCLKQTEIIHHIHLIEVEGNKKKLDKHSLRKGWRNLSKTAKKGFLQPMRSEC